MITEGKMTPAGMELYKFAEIPEYFTQALRNNPKARKTFKSLSPSNKLQYLGWIIAAKKEETRSRRMKDALDLLEAGKKLGMK